MTPRTQALLGSFRKGCPNQGRIKPTSSDVLLGRGRGMTQHSGNRRFQQLIEEHNHSYRQANRDARGSICLTIVNAVKTWGRFLDRRCSGDGWSVATDERARKKVGQALRYRIRQSAPTPGSVGSTNVNNDSAADSSGPEDEEPPKMESVKPPKKEAVKHPMQLIQPKQTDEVSLELVFEALSDPLLHLEGAEEGSSLEPTPLRCSSGFGGNASFTFCDLVATKPPPLATQDSLLSFMSGVHLPFPVCAHGSFSPDTEKAIIDIFGPRNLAAVNDFTSF